MGNRFASGKNAISECDRCGQRFKLKVLKTEIIKTKNYNLLVCPECWDPDHPQLQLGMYPVDDPQALRNPVQIEAIRFLVCWQMGIAAVVAEYFNGAGTLLVGRVVLMQL